MESFSYDNGRIWSKPEKTSLRNPNSAVELIRLNDGRLLLVYNDSSVKRTPLVVALSEDDGETWHNVIVLEKEEGEFSYPSAVEHSDGIVHIVYTYKRQAIKHITIKV